MSSDSETEEGDVHHGELVIIRHRADHEEGHHGGVWKIAYADFMTAMMAFFLVMWLINAANEETKSQVASYFNPIKLIDSRTSTKGLQELDAGAEGKSKSEQEGGASEKDKAGNAEKGEFKPGAEKEMKEPSKSAEGQVGPASQDVLNRETEAMDAQGSEGPAQRGGEAYLDPFDPQSWQQMASEVNKPGPGNGPTPQESGNQSPTKQMAGAEQTAGETEGDKTAGAPTEQSGDHELKTAENNQSEAQRGSASATSDDQGNAATHAERASQPASQDKNTGNQAAPQSGTAQGQAQGAAQTQNPETKEIERELKAIAGNAVPGSAPLIEVRKTGDGVLISLTDSANFGMFEIASAKPKAELAKFMQGVAKIINDRAGNVIISGHTDGRPFRSEVYDNWKLSTARAQEAYYMLVKAGINAGRVERIEGHADRDLKMPDDPNAAQNRRIEILLRESQT